MRAKTIVAVLLAAVAIAAGIIIGAGAATHTTYVAAVLLDPDPESPARGMAYFRQRGSMVSGWVAVWGLTPGTRHAVHFHGPDGACAGPARDAVATHRDLVADRRGVAFASLSLRATSLVLKRGVYYNVHEQGVAAGKTPSIACGDLKPERLR